MESGRPNLAEPNNPSLDRATELDLSSGIGRRIVQTPRGPSSGEARRDLTNNFEIKLEVRKERETGADGREGPKRPGRLFQSPETDLSVRGRFNSGPDPQVDMDEREAVLLLLTRAGHNWLGGPPGTVDGYCLHSMRCR